MSSHHVHDIQWLLELEREYVPGTEKVRVRWGFDRAGVAFRSIHFGQYTPERSLTGLPVGLVTVHPRLDDLRVPEWFVGFIIYHELIHARLGTSKHPREFRRLEALHARYHDAQAWQREHIKAIVSATWSPSASS